MSPRRRELWLVVATATALLWALCTRIDPAVVPPQWDEFILLTNARRLYEGQRPFVDYVWFLPPGCEALYAAWFGLTGGPSAGSARLLGHLLVVATALCWYAALRSLRLSPAWAAAAALALPAVFFPVWATPLHHWTAQAHLALAALLLVRGLRAPAASSPRWLAAAGVAWALCALSVQTQGVLGLALLGGLWWRGGARPAEDTARRASPDPRPLVAFALGAAGPALALLVYLLAAGALGAFVQAAVLYVFGNYRQSGGVNDTLLLGDLSLRMARLWQLPAPLWVRLPLVSVEGLTPWVSLGVPMAAGAAALQAALRAPPGQRARELWLLPALAVAGLVFAVRPDVLHLAFYGGPLVVTSLLGLALLPPAYTLLRRLSLGAWLGLVALGLLAHHGLTILQGARPVPVFARVHGVDPTVDGLPWVDAHMIAQSPLLMLLRRHHLQFPQQRLLALPEGAVAYFLAMPPAVPDTLLLPAAARYDGPVEYARTLAALRARPAEVLVLTPWEQGRGFLEPPAWAGDEARALAAFLVENYALRAQVGAARVYLREGAAASEPTAASPPSSARSGAVLDVTP